MNNIILKWIYTNESENIKISCENIESSIIINSRSKEIEGIKIFFREIVYKSFFENREILIQLENPPTEELNEAYRVIDEVVSTCNQALSNIYIVDPEQRRFFKKSKFNL